jgi:hypothetical protein
MEKDGNSLEMASAGTLLSDLDGSGGGDGDLVQKILSDMNIPTQDAGMRAPPQPMPVQRHENQGYEQEPNTNQHITMDSRIPTSHMIGNEHPTQAEFAAAMIGMGSSNQGVAMSGAGMPGMQMPGMPGMQMPGMPGMQAPASEPTKNLYTYIVNEIKIPFVVAILFFIFSLPPIRIILSHYMPSLIRPTGEFHISGLLVISLTMGATFWLMHRVIAPLLSL